MLIKILFILLLIIIFRTIIMGMGKIDHMKNDSKKKTKADDDVIEAKFKIVKDDE